MWSVEVTGECAATPAQVFSVLAEPEKWSEWNKGVLRIEMHGAFQAGTTAVMVLPDSTRLPFRFAWVEADKGFEDVTEVPDAGVLVRVRHELSPTEHGTLITYRCEVDGPEPVAGTVGEAVTSDFADVIAALGLRAEQLGE
ncbi:SRPBCC family protein [Burkholderia aenigmatica]|uniref:SRPBCC family protein n=1 Tax=Burkholderia cepacia complex TaxID=87882 RepID=UPI0013DDEF5E|nr:MULTISPECIES: SRPBCC family protein [Burkholderia cepacia complex]UKD17149.1 SRPBCC family protein [Burkholderia aenigmatica]